MTRPGSRHSFVRVWRWPGALATLTVFGLLSALLGQGGIWWVLSWIALSMPLVTAAIASRHRRENTGRNY
jgi:hypothetical protein